VEVIVIEDKKKAVVDIATSQKRGFDNDNSRINPEMAWCDHPYTHQSTPSTTPEAFKLIDVP